MTVLRALLVTMTVGIVAYTGIAGSNHGWDLVSVFFGVLKAMTWSGQFNFDFLCYLILSAVWVAWRHGFSAGGLLLAAMASVLGILFFAPYLLWASFDAQGNVKTILLGRERVAA